MKTRSLICGLLPLLTTVFSSSDLLAEDKIRIRIPNPITHIGKRLHQVGDFFARTARKLESADESPEESRDDAAPIRPPRKRTSPPAVAANSAVSNEAAARDSTVALQRSVPPEPSGGTPAPVPSPQPHPTNETPRQPTTNSPSETSPNASPLAGASNSTVMAPTPTASKPAPLPKHPYGKPVPGRPGMVYPPGVKAAPENMVDVRDIAPGTKVRDPGTGIIFLVP